MNWTIDSAHSSASFKVRHMGISNVRGDFSDLRGAITLDEAGNLQSVRVSIPVDTVNTGNAGRDEHLKKADFFDAEQFPSIEFVSTDVTRSGEGYRVSGNLTMHGVTHAISFKAEVSQPITDPMSGKRKIGGEAALELSRKDYGLTWNAAIETGGVMVSDKVSINLEVQAVEE